MSEDPELHALGIVNSALQGLDPGAQKRVLEYVSRKLGVPLADNSASGSGPDQSQDATAPEEQEAHVASGSKSDDLDGISPIAQKWIRRSGLNVDQLSRLFSLGVD